tara:strand:+ start:650473 stop:650652 length:180 start_codon:yes stop_codon:yes gene_type:complete
MDFRTPSAAAPIVKQRSGKYFLVEKFFFVEPVPIRQFVAVWPWRTAVDVVSFAAAGRTS